MSKAKDINMEVMKVHNLFWGSYARRDIELRFSLCSEDVTFIGSGLHERALNKTEYKNINKEGVKQFPNPFQIEFLWTNLSMINEIVACVESEVVWSQMINNEISTELLRNTTLLKYDNSKWLVTHVHGSVPDYRLKDGDYMTNEQTIIRNKELERQVFERTQDLNKTLEKLEGKNRELEIEASLEKVRTIAMGMREPADMLDVCKTISLQLQSLGVKEIRNVQTAIFYEHRGSYMNYEFYAKHDKTFITETVFTNNEIHNEFATKMLRGKGETFITHIKDDEVKDWIAYQKTTNVFIDKYLENASSLNYYWFSLGPVALGISTYIPLAEDEINLFKRFLKVFELAYQRYLDIEIAEAQAREAQIQLALERVRARTMAMQKSDELKEVVVNIFEGMSKLGFDPAVVNIALINNVTYDFDVWTAHHTDEGATAYMVRIPYFNHPFREQLLESFRQEISFSTHELSGELKKSYDQLFIKYVDISNVPDDVKLLITELPEIESLVLSAAYTKQGLLIMSRATPATKYESDILQRFAKLFEQTYTRFLDLQKAEAQAREAQIEAALEKIRSRALAMRNSSEVGNVSTLLFLELEKMDINPSGFSIMIFDEAQDKYELWRAKEVAHQGAYETFSIKGMYDKFDQYVPGFGEELKSAWTMGNPFFVGEFRGKERVSFLQANREMANYSDEAFEKMKKSWPDPTFWHLVFFKYGWFGVLQNEQLIKEDLLLIHRFAEVFDFAYTRFLDLQKAEAQAREAQIEAALERVRSRTMGMQKSEELKEVIRVVYEQFVHLKINVDHAGFVVDYTPKGDWHFWIADEQDIPSKITHPYFESVWANQLNETKEKGADFFATNLNFEEKNKFYNELLSYVPGLPEASKDFYLSCPGLAASTVLLENVSLYIENFSGIAYTDEENATLMRFGKVFQQTYTRFLDLQKAEAQTREAQIEAALERVRSKALAMYNTNDLSQTVSTFFKELRSLNVLPWRCGVGQINEETKTTFLTTTSNTINGESFEVRGALQQEGHPVLDGIFEHWKLQKEFYPVLQGDEIRKYYEIIRPQIAYPKYPLDAIQYGHFIFIKEGFVFAWTENKLSEVELGIFRRFASVLSLTYRRYLDLKEAEEQNRIIQADNERKTKELEEARQLQLSLLPRELPKLPNLDIAVYMKTATEVGGDYYDFNVDDDGTLTAAIGDATGHGMKAGTIVSMIKALFASGGSHLDIKTFFNQSSAALKGIELGRLMMAFIMLKIKSNKLVFANAGMPSLFIYRNKTREVEETMLHGMPLGAMKDFPYEIRETEITPGDTLLLLSDGLPELKNEKNEQYDYERVKEEFKSVADKSPNDIVEYMKSSASKWSNGIEPDDDVTFVVIKVK